MSYSITIIIIVIINLFIIVIACSYINTDLKTYMGVWKISRCRTGGKNRLLREPFSLRSTINVENLNIQKKKKMYHFEFLENRF